MRRRNRLLRIAYWWRIVADAVIAIPMLSPRLFVRLMRVDLPLTPGFVYDLRMGAPLMIGLTILLFWANRKPAARRDILLVTLPVILGYVVIEAHALIAGDAEAAATIPLFVMQAGLMTVFIIAYARASEASPGRVPPPDRVYRYQFGAALPRGCRAPPLRRLPRYGRILTQPHRRVSRAT